MDICKESGCNEPVLTFIRKTRNGPKRIQYQICRSHWGEVGRRNATQYKDSYINSQGYVNLVGGIAEHRKIMEDHLGRELLQGESVHHKNGVRTDNRIENLELWTTTHPSGQRVNDLICPHCGKGYAEPSGGS